MEITNRKFRLLVKKAFIEDNGILVLFIFVNSAFTKMNVRRYFIYVLHILKWIDLRKVNIFELTERDLYLSVINNVKGVENELIREEDLFEVLGVSRQRMKHNFNELLTKYDGLTIKNVISIIDEWTGEDWSQVKGIGLGRFQEIVNKLSEESYYPKKIKPYLVDKKITGKFNQFGFDSSNMNVRVLPPIIVQILLLRYFDPDEVNYSNFLEELKIN